ncbi:prepilin-type N-terminal cleavage/methylation domain-containing protein [Candidatus Peregrinibacteria bacterium]|nr:prepilin-type N-terminal cleavage/methylation domain-containing protein [Candidatus Peregrinibacteria bacterium]
MSQWFNKKLGNPRIRNVSGFTFVELAIVIAIFSIVLGAAVMTLGNFMGNQSLRSDGEKVVQTLREAHVRSTASEWDSSWGVYFDVVATPNRLVLFKGTDYSLRDPTFDQTTDLYPTVTFGPLLLNGGGSEIVFSKRSGLIAQDGLFSLVSNTQAFTVAVNPLGLTDFTTPTL